MTIVKHEPIDEIDARKVVRSRKAALGFEQPILLIQQNRIQKIVLWIFQILLRRKILFWRNHRIHENSRIPRSQYLSGFAGDW
jgi:hypothetical protein